MTSHGHTPTSFAQALDALRGIRYRNEFTVDEAPAPSRLAPFAYAQTLDIDYRGEEIGSGRLVILHDPEGRDSWLGETRIIAYIDTEVESEVATDPLLTEVGWDWLSEGIENAGAPARALGGTVTQVNSRSFGALDERAPEGRIQVRASWTAADNFDLIPHAIAWAHMASSCAGLTPEGTTAAGFPGPR